MMSVAYTHQHPVGIFVDHATQFLHELMNSLLLHLLFVDDSPKLDQLLVCAIGKPSFEDLAHFLLG